jgi:hypothetical protein
MTNSADILVKSIPLQLAAAQQSSEFSCDFDTDMECEPENTNEGWCNDNIDNDRDNEVDSNDNDGASQSGDQIPVANAGPDQTVGIGQEVLLDGTGSYDPEGKLVSSEWEQTSGPNVQLSGADTLQPTFTAPSEEESKDLTFELVVYDGEGPSESDTVTVTVQPTLPHTQPTARLGNTFSSTLSQVESTTVQLGNTFSSILSKINDPVSVLKQNDLSRLLPLAGLGVAAIVGMVAYAKHRSSKKSHLPGGNVAVITRGGID